MGASRGVSVGLLAIVLALSACASRPPAGRSSADVQVGDCFRFPTVQALRAATDNSPPVSCAGPHDAEVLSTFSYSGRYASRLTRPLPEQLQGELTPRCSSYRAIRDYLGAGPLDAQWGVGVVVRVPTANEWRGGIRTIRCDLVADDLGADGPTVSTPLRGVLQRGDSARFRLCYDAAKATTCAQQHDAEAVAGAPLLPGGALLEPAALLAEAQGLCGAAIADYLGRAMSADLVAKPLVPTKQRWARGDRHVDCAFGPAEAGRLVTGSLRAATA